MAAVLKNVALANVAVMRSLWLIISLVSPEGGKISPLNPTRLHTKCIVGGIYAISLLYHIKRYVVGLHHRNLWISTAHVATKGSITLTGVRILYYYTSIT